ncbi:DUF2663 family protein [Paenibacillus sp. MBLB4367]|uniref:DUF2663 family protein n=1 Tax=Paenibacillus sp. MBLB4367 TaxID=3384767 RepID=UPI003907F680
MDWESVDISEDTKTILNELVERKVKLDHITKMKNLYSGITLFIVAVSVYYFYRYLLLPSNNDMLKLVGLFSGNAAHLFLLAALATLYIVTNNYMKSYGKQKSKYETLRIEAIDHLHSTWVKSKSSAIRDIISKHLKDKHNINVSHKS